MVWRSAAPGATHLLIWGQSPCRAYVRFIDDYDMSIIELQCFLLQMVDQTSGRAIIMRGMARRHGSVCHGSPPISTAVLIPKAGFILRKTFIDLQSQFPGGNKDEPASFDLARRGSWEYQKQVFFQCRFGHAHHVFAFEPMEWPVAGFGWGGELSRSRILRMLGAIPSGKTTVRVNSLMCFLLCIHVVFIKIFAID